jgi:hypothetical protein
MLDCAHVHIRTNKKSKITQFYTRLAKIKGSSKAAVAKIKVTKSMKDAKFNIAT